jgi:hypothetical protein
MRHNRLRLGVFAFLFAMLCASIGAGTALAVQTHMVNARGDLQSALDQLNAATADKAGHRASAINLVNQALSQVSQGIAAGAR